jgi:DNA-binding GntR family transcriptional regulator
MVKQNTLLNLLADGQIQPNERKLLGTETAEKLRELILLEKLPAGMFIPERDIAEVLGISHTPMREALRILEMEGLIEYTSTRRSRGADPSIEELLQSMRVLRTLEALGGEIACSEATQKDLDKIIELNQMMLNKSESLSSIVFFKTDMEFHSSIISASRNNALIETHRTYNAKLWRARFLSSRRKRGCKTTLQQHQDITDALCSRDALAISKAMRGHIETAMQNLERPNSEVDQAVMPVNNPT